MVVRGYVRMLLKDRAGPLNDQQRKQLEETEKSCARLSDLLTEVSDLENLEASTASFQRQAADLRELLKTAVAQLPALPDREIPVTLQSGNEAAPVEADPTRLALALTSVIAALRRELVGSDELVVRQQRVNDGIPRYRILIGGRDTVEVLERNTAELPVFDEWRGGCGMSLPVARRVINAHGGGIWSPPDGHKGGALIFIPASA